MCLAMVVVACVAATSQVAVSEAPAGNQFFVQAAPATAAVGAVGAAGPDRVMFFRAEIADSGKTVVGAPYTAIAVTETTQTLADGNHISNKTSANVARDSQGRTRREEVLGKVGPWPVDGPQLTFIHDPVSKSDTVLDSNDHTARVLKPGKFPPGARVIRKMHYAEKATGKQGDVKTESLGTQTIEGIAAEGKRVTRTIPAGEIGNERPLEIVSEVWYSPDLQVVVMSKHSDPRMGETTYRLTDIKRVEPDHSLFAVPNGYTVKQGPPEPPPLPEPPK
jgi:hypothetical protein